MEHEDIAEMAARNDVNTAMLSVQLKPSNVEDLYLLARIAPPDIRRDVCARVEKKKRELNVSHSLCSDPNREPL